jgi:hypothetical protein
VNALCTEFRRTPSPSATPRGGGILSVVTTLRRKSWDGHPVDLGEGFRLGIV